MNLKHPRVSAFAVEGYLILMRVVSVLSRRQKKSGGFAFGYEFSQWALCLRERITIIGKGLPVGISGMQFAQIYFERLGAVFVF